MAKYDVVETIRLFPDQFTMYEQVSIITRRTEELTLNSPPLIEIGDETNEYKIALAEFNKGILPIKVYRKRNDGRYTECIMINAK